MIAALRARGVPSLAMLRRVSPPTLEAHLPVTAFAAITRGLQEEQARMAARPKKPRGLQVKYLWAGQRMEITLPFEELRACTSVMELVRGLSKKGNTRLEALGVPTAELMRPSLIISIVAGASPSRDFTSLIFGNLSGCRRQPPQRMLVPRVPTPRKL